MCWRLSQAQKGDSSNEKTEERSHAERSIRDVLRGTRKEIESMTTSELREHLFQALAELPPEKQNTVLEVWRKQRSRSQLSKTADGDWVQ